MARYIDADKFVDIINSLNTVQGSLSAVYITDVIQALYTVPTADVQEIRHGMWMYCGKSSGHDHVWQCSECLRTESTKHKSDIKDYPYCHCGAKMDGKE